MKIKLPLILFLLFNLLSFQNYSISKFRLIDSLNREIRSESISNIEKVNLLTALAKEYNRQENYFEANQANIEALKLFEKLGDKKLVCKTLVEIGMVYDKQNQFDQAFKYFFESLEELEKIKDEYSINDYQIRKGLILMNIGIIYGQVKNSKQSLKVLLEAKQLFENSNEFYQAICNENLGNVYFDLNQNEKALQYFNDALLFYNQNEVDPILKANTLSNIGNVHSEMFNYDEALQKYKEALTVIGNNGLYISERISFLNSIGDVYIDLDELETAKKYLNNSLALSKSNGGNRYIKNNYSSLVKLYTKEKNFKEAYNNLRILKSIEDSFYEPEVLERIAKVQKEYDLKALERENVLKIQLLENEKSLYWYKIYIIVAIVIVLLLVLVTLYIRQKNKSLLDKEKLKNITLEKQQLSDNLEFKNHQLTNFAMYIVRKNEFLENIKVEIDNIISASKEKSLIKPLSSLVNQHLVLAKDQKEFDILIEEQNKDFFYKLEKKYPDLSENNKKMCSLLLLNLSSKEIASLLNISVGSVEKSRHRLRKKLNLESEINISDFLNKL